MPVAYRSGAATGASDAAATARQQDAGLRTLLALSRPAADAARPRAPGRPAGSPPAVPTARTRRIRRARVPLPLLVVLTVQAVLSVRLIHADTAFSDEALYLWAGHLEWAHWLHGARIPAFPTYFSGAPVIYPPLGALADSIGGLAAARLLSLGFMLGVTALLWGTAARLSGRRAAFFATALFAVAGPTLHLGSFATYDAMALFLLALACWCATGARRRTDATGWILGAAGALAAANATKYATALFDPAVIAVAVLCACPEPGGKAALRRGTLLTACLTGALAGLIRLGGPWYLLGIEQTTTLRSAGGSTASMVLRDCWDWTAAVLLLAWLAVLAAALLRQRRSRVLLLAVLAAAALLVPAEQARIHTTVSLDKHVDFGIWFAAIAAGSALAWLTRLAHHGPSRVLATAACAPLVLALAAAGVAQSYAMVNWPDSVRLIAFLRPRVGGGGHFLAEDAGVPEYYLRAQTSWRQWSSTFSIALPSGQVRNEHGNPAPYVEAIRRHYFRLVILSFTDTVTLDRRIRAALNDDKDYRPIGSFPLSGAAGPAGNAAGYRVWQYQPPAHAGRAA
jgi:4-amino-4-deoxy-L-arabinose transferase-like glycosyltransferase